MSADGGYAHQIEKPPVWTWEIPLYFFVGGLAGMSAVIALAAHTVGDAHTGHAALRLAFAGALISPPLLILDLGRPRRFLNMLRVVKPQSPMSMGVWTLIVFSASVTLALAPRELASLGALRPLEIPALLVAAASGSVLATYTGVLIGATALPVWHLHHRLLPVHAGAAGLGSAVGALELLGRATYPLHALGLVAAIAETLLAAWLELRRHGEVDRALREGHTGLAIRGSYFLMGPLSLGLRLIDAAVLAASAFLLGALLSRYAWMAAARRS